MIKSKLLLISMLAVVFALASGAFFFYQKGANKKEQEITIKQQQTYIDTRKRIDEAANKNQSFDSAVDKLRTRQQNRTNK